jgi:hypothetical protein
MLLGVAEKSPQYPSKLRYIEQWYIAIGFQYLIDVTKKSLVGF